MTDHLLLAMPDDVVARLLREARRRHADPAQFLVHLVSSEIPSAFADAVRDLLAPQIATPPALTEGATRRQTDEDPVDPSISPAGVGSELNASGHGIET